MLLVFELAENRLARALFEAMCGVEENVRLRLRLRCDPACPGVVLDRIQVSARMPGFVIRTTTP